MSDTYQTVADLDADTQSAQVTAARLRDWMISREIIVPAESDCVLGDYLGHAPGANYTLAIQDPYPLLFNLRTNGVAFIAKHSVFPAMGLEMTLVCSSCGMRFGTNDAWSAAVEDWYLNNGIGMLGCVRCGSELAIAEWQHDPPWAFGNVGVEFWNWPPLREEFLKDLAGVVGHRFRLVYGKF